MIHRNFFHLSLFCNTHFKAFSIAPTSDTHLATHCCSGASFQKKKNEHLKVIIITITSRRSHVVVVLSGLLLEMMIGSLS